MNRSLSAKIEQLENLISSFSQSIPHFPGEELSRDSNISFLAGSPHALGEFSDALTLKLREAQDKMNRLAENNRLLILELEEKRGMLRDIHRRYENSSKSNQELRDEIASLKKRALRSEVPMMEREILSSVESAQNLMSLTQAALEEERKKFLSFLQQKEKKYGPRPTYDEASPSVSTSSRIQDRGVVTSTPSQASMSSVSPGIVRAQKIIDDYKRGK
eukprot:TRINITY_DN2683_c1_g1_i3.p1 TRINITY_DN2683_c1_g1~~TRINITY_DN2683_c1_g1_i3.p1  ORF type:complete len:218 (+),score=78.80 TRINITY_DN2683_c1_g1_i3:281-934(+)